MSSTTVDGLIAAPFVVAGAAVVAAAGLVGGALNLVGALGSNFKEGISEVFNEIHEENKRRLQLERGWVNDLRNEREKAFNDINAFVSSLVKLSESDEKMFGLLDVKGSEEQARSLIDKREARARKIRQLRDKAIKSKDVDEIEACTEEARRLFDGLEPEIREELFFFGKNGLELLEYGTMHEDAVKMALAKKNNVFEVKLKSAENVRFVTESMVKNDITLFEDSLSELLCEEGLNDRQVRDIFAIRQDLRKISEDRSISLEIKKKRLATLFETFSRRQKAIRAELKEMSKYYDEYLDETFDIPEERIELADFDSVDEIADALKKAKEERIERIQKQYIRIQTDRVMKKHGLNVVESAVVGREADDKRILYGIDETAGVDVFISDSGTIATRVVGFSFGQTPTLEQEKELEKKGHGFCSKMAAIEADLEDVGIIARRKKTIQPEQDYYTWISLDESRSVSKSGTNRKRRRQTGGKVMYME